MEACPTVPVFGAVKPHLHTPWQASRRGCQAPPRTSILRYFDTSARLQICNRRGSLSAQAGQPKFGHRRVSGE